MATTIRWIDNSSVEQGHRIYKSDTYFTKDNLPPMLVELGPNVEEYVDEDGEDGENWYIVSAFIAGYEAFSEPFIGGLTTASIHDIFGDGSAVATYRFDGDASDLGGNFDGTWSGTEEYADDGVIRQAASFDGNSYIMTNTPSIFGAGAESSVSFFSKASSAIDGGLMYFCGTRNPSSLSDRYYIAINNYSLAVRIGSSTIQNIYPYDFFDKWAHIAITLNSTGDLIAYLNGEEIFSQTYSTFTPRGNLWIGTINNGGTSDSEFLGEIDQFRIFNRPLTEEEVQILYQEGAAFL